jgi:hypothetical protein
MPAGDGMGSDPGCSDPRNSFDFHYDRIVDLELQQNIDDALQHDVIVGMWWASRAVV